MHTKRIKIHITQSIYMTSCRPARPTSKRDNSVTAFGLQLRHLSLYWQDRQGTEDVKGWPDKLPSEVQNHGHVYFRNLGIIVSSYLRKATSRLFSSIQMSKYPVPFCSAEQFLYCSNRDPVHQTGSNIAYRKVYKLTIYFDGLFPETLAPHT